MNKITILHLCEHFGDKQVSFHGVSRLFELWIPAFDTNRFRVLLCSRKGPSELADQRLKAAGIAPLYLGYGKMDPRNLFKLITLMRREKVDVLHAHGYGACTWGRLAGILLGKPVIVHEHCNYGTVPAFQRPAEWVLGHFTSHAYAVSESTRQFTIEKRYIPAARVETLYSGIPLDQIHQVEPVWVASFRREQGRKPEDKILGVVGRLESHKGHLDAFKALQLILKERSDVTLWVLGNGRYEETLRQWVKDNALTDRITFLGYRSDVVKVIQCFDIQLFPSHQEGTPSTLFEGMAVGNVCVASTADGQGEILRDGEDALLFKPGDIEALARLTLKVLADPYLARRLRLNALARIKDFDMKRCLDVMERKYEGLTFLSRSSTMES
jgi:glycosyltransferase involved in cell wall biosynthesis